MYGESALRESLLTFEFYGRKIPVSMHSAILNYIVNHRRPGDFLCAIFRNDFIDAACRADDANRWALAAYAAFLIEYVPDSSYGSAEKFEAWIAKGAANEQQLPST